VAAASWSVVFLGIVADSRCPIDATCIWAGDAVIAVEVTAADGVTERSELRLGGDGRGAIALGGAIELVIDGLEPLPLASEPTAPGDYSIVVSLIESHR